MIPSSFEQLAASDEIDVAEGAALLARDVYATLDVEDLLTRFDALAEPIARDGISRMVATDAARAISRHVYETLGFKGNEDDYYDPRNSLLPDVIERRLGIPISLALVYCEVARRVGIRAEGVSFPGHFLVRVHGVRDARGATEALVDPFHRGRVLDDESLGALFERVSGQVAKPNVAERKSNDEEALAGLRPEMLAPATGRAFLSRWLMNLRAIYLSRGDLPRAMLVVDRLVSLNPRDKALFRDRGFLAARLGANAAARADLSRALAMDPSSEAASELRAALAQLDEKPSAAN